MLQRGYACNFHSRTLCVCLHLHVGTSSAHIKKGSSCTTINGSARHNVTAYRTPNGSIINCSPAFYQLNLLDNSKQTSVFNPPNTVTPITTNTHQRETTMNLPPIFLTTLLANTIAAPAATLTNSIGMTALEARESNAHARVARRATPIALCTPWC